ncbi:hypothetical protein ITI46_05175 [Streptomyces oryzae]|uniref:Trypsin-co-occurring domain-containing protein n=1 Tax=Streptomyces oryzae TaxID=1434886 RepID=A0ABS3X6X9_9ACTN|nr:trypco2 family protein [Streptomyces oryzae]MBO8191088.1 hypothetical protein [Streptomyces oryzae]
MTGDGRAAGQALDLADAITLLRDQISEAQQRIDMNGDGGLRFTLGEITLELGLELAQASGADGGLRFSVVGMGGKRESTRTATHTLTVPMRPHLSDGGAIDVSDDDSDEDDA